MEKTIKEIWNKQDLCYWAMKGAEHELETSKQLLREAERLYNDAVTSGRDEDAKYLEEDLEVYSDEVDFLSKKKDEFMNDFQTLTTVLQEAEKAGIFQYE